jgi:pyruvate-ferredoxin/flavodoxin oxidoreductase
MVSEYLELDEDEREDKVPFVWALDAKRELSRLLVSDVMIESAEDRRSFWVMLRELAAMEESPAVEDDVQVESRIRQEVVQKIASGLMGLVSGNQALDMRGLHGPLDRYGGMHRV